MEQLVSHSARDGKLGCTNRFGFAADFNNTSLIYHVIFVGSALRPASCLGGVSNHRLTEYGKLSVCPDGLGQSPRSDLTLVLGVVIERRVLDPNVVLALFLAAHDRVARKGRDRSFETCNTHKKSNKHRLLLNVLQHNPLH